MALILQYFFAMGKRALQSSPSIPGHPATDSVLFEHLFEHSPDAIVLVDDGDQIVRINPAFETLFGYTAEDSIGRPVNELLVDPGFRDEASELSGQVLAGRPVRVESMRRCRDGSLLHVEVSGVPIRSARGQIGIFGIYRDISARRNAEELLRQRERQYRHIVETLIDGYFELDSDGNLTFCNAAFRQILELSERDVVGFRPLGQVSARQRRRLLVEVRRAVGNRAVARGLSLALRPRGGASRTVECSVSAICNASDRVVGYRGTLRDVTERARAEARIAESEQVYRTMALATGQLVYDADFATGAIRWLGAVEAVLGCAPEAAERFDLDEWSRRIHPDDRDAALEGLERARREGRGYLAEYRFRRDDGQWIDVIDRGSFIGASKQGPRMIGTMTDVTERKREQQAFARAREQAQVTLDAISDAVIRIDAEARVEYINPQACRLVGCAAKGVLGRPLDAVLRVSVWDEHGQPRRIGTEVLLDAEVGPPCDEMWIDDRCGHCADIELSITALDPGATDGGWVVVFRDVTEHRRKSRQIAWQAEHDPLTGLYNRRKFETTCETLLDGARDQQRHCLLYLDLDQFKLVNDSCGHHVGDQLLCELAALMRKQIRRSDLLARLGGDEFALLLQDCPLDRGMQIAEKLVQAINEFEFVWQQQRFQVGVSIGVVELSAMTTLAEALQAADQACYMAKDKGRNRISAFRPDDQEQQRHGIQLRTALALTEALRNDRFRLYFQRIETLNEDLPGRHCEILLRMLDEHGQLVSPAVFIPAAERFDKILMLDRWVVEHTLEALGRAALRGEIGANDRFSINLSGATFSHSDSLPFVVDRLRKSGVDPRTVCFEITESNAISRWSDAHHFIDEIRRLGCLISLDDFGSGFSSFGYLKRLPIDAIKIDGGLVGDMRSSRLGRAMVGGIAQIARVASIPCVAEQVERTEDLALLRELGIDYAQGFCLHRPEPWPWTAPD